MVKQYRVLHAVHANAREKNRPTSSNLHIFTVKHTRVQAVADKLIQVKDVSVSFLNQVVVIQCRPEWMLQCLGEHVVICAV